MNQNLNTLPYGARFLPQNLDSTTGRPLSDSFLYQYQGYTNTTIRQTGGTFNFHSLQVQATRRYAKGVEMQVVYTWSKYMDYGGSFPLYLSRRWFYGRAGDDRTHNLKLAWVWDLPHIDRFTKNIVAKSVIDGWQLAGIASFISGAPQGVGFNLPSGLDLTGGGDGQRIVELRDPVLSRGDRSFTRWFDPTAFAEPALGTVGSAPKDVFRGPGINSWDIAMKREFKFREKGRLVLRMDTYNAFNHTQFSGVNATARFDANGNQTNTGFGFINGARAPRRAEGSIRVTF